MNAKKLRTRIRSINFTLSVTFTLIIVIAISLLGIYSYYNFARILEEKSSQNNRLIMLSINESIEHYIEQLDILTSSVFIFEVQNHLRTLNKIENKYSWSFIEENSKMFKFFYSWAGLKKFDNEIERMFIINPDGSFYEENYGVISEKYNFLNSEIYKDAVKNKGMITLKLYSKEEYTIDIQSYDTSPYLIISRKINDKIGADDLGVFVVVIRWYNVERIINSIISKENSDYIILNDNGNVMFTSSGNYEGLLPLLPAYSEQGSNVYTHNNKDYLVNIYTSPKIGWKFISISSFQEVFKDIYSTRRAIILIILIAFVLTLAISIVFSRSILKPINKLTGFVIQMENGIPDERINLKSYYEFNLLAKAFNNMTESLAEMINKNYILSIKNKESQLKVLHAQINPHFLYNTLNSICAYARINNVKEIMYMTQALSDIFRYSIQSGDELVYISDEISHIRNYLTIQNIRYGDEISIVYSFDEAIYKLKTVRFILQPLVENSIYHGLETKEGNREIRISGFRNADKVIFQIIDNGVGIPENKLNEIKNQLNMLESEFSEDKSKDIGIGMINVHQRIRMIWGNEYGISLESREGHGVKLEVAIPAVE